MSSLPRSARLRAQRQLRALALGGAVGLASLAYARGTWADVQVTSGLTSGVAVTDLRGPGKAGVAAHLGARAELLFGRSGPKTMGIGPYAQLHTVAFRTIEWGGGLSWMFPTWGSGAVLSGGAFARSSVYGVEPGVAARLFWGSRSYNHFSPYALAVGLFSEGRYGLGDSKQGDVLFGVQLDLEYLALPFLYLYSSFK